MSRFFTKKKSLYILSSFILQSYIIFLITEVKKLQKTKSVESVESSTGTSLASSVQTLSKEKKEKEYTPSNWEIMKLCAPEKWWMFAGIVAAIAVGSSFPTFAVLFGETYGVCIVFDIGY